MEMHLYIIHTPYQYFVAECIAKSTAPEGDIRHVLCTEFDCSALVEPKNPWNEILHIGRIGVHAFGRGKKRMSLMNLDLIKGCITSSGSVRIFMSDIGWIMNNLVFFDPDLRRRDDIHFNIFEDGVGAYYQSRMTAKRYLKNTVKFVCSSFNLCPRYTPYTGNVMGVEEPRIEKVYGFCPELLVAPKNKVVGLTSRLAGDGQSEAKLHDSHGLFLDQYSTTKELEHALDRLYPKIWDMLNAAGHEKIYYKPHFFTAPDVMDFWRSKEVEFVTGMACIEQIFSTLRCGHVYSFSSSALFNLKGLYREKLNATSVCPEIFFPVRHECEGLLFLYKSVGVNVIQI